MKTLLTISCTFLSCAILLAQPMNNYCEGAIELSEQFLADENCIDLGWRSVDVSLAGANPQTNIPGCVLDGAPSVWYQITASTAGYILSMKLSGTPGTAPALQLFQGTCETLQPVSQCYVSYRGPLYTMDIEALPGINYYVLLGDARVADDSLRFSWSKREEGIPCMNQDDLRPVYRSGGQVVSGPYLPGDTIGFEYECRFLVSTGAQNCQWMQGVVPVFGSSWDPGSFTANGQPLHATMNGSPFPANNLHNGGQWNWWDNVRYHHPHCYMNIIDPDNDGRLEMCDGRMEPDCNGDGLVGGCCGPCWNSTGPDEPGSGDLLPAGWFSSHVDGSCGGLVGWPAVDWGDGNTCNGQNGPWIFYFELIVPQESDPLVPEDFSIVMHTFADGEVGSWTGGPSVCSADYPQRFDPVVITSCDTSEGKAFLAGRLFADNNASCAFDFNDAGVRNRIVKVRSVASGITRLLMTFSDGSFEMHADTGSYWVIPVLEGVEPLSCPDSVQVHLNAPCEIFHVDFPVDNPLLCNEAAEFSLTSGTYRICEPGNMRISMINTGEIAYVDPRIHFQLDTQLTLISANVEYEDLGGNNFLLYGNTVFPDQQLLISLGVFVSCDAQPMDLHCSEATLLTPVCDGSEVNDSWCLPNGVAIDPNFKIDASDFSFDITNITDASPIDYQVHFQNTGSSYAKRVTILDTLPLNLDVSTFQFTGSSHPVQISLLDDHILRFFFDNINLPDSTTNEPGSHGVVTFRIRPVSDIVRGEKIQNHAAIYFDFSAPVITNLKEHEVVCTPDENSIVHIHDTLCDGDFLVIHGETFDQFRTEGEVIVPNVLPNGCDSVYFVSLDYHMPITFDSVRTEADHGAGTGAVYLYPPAGSNYTFTWSNGNQSSSVTNLSVGQYSVTVTDGNGCSVIQQFTVEIETAAKDVARKDFSIWPNPASDRIILEFDGAVDEASIVIRHLDGRNVWAGTLMDESSISIPVSDLSPAMYLIEIRRHGSVDVGKFIRSIR